MSEKNITAVVIGLGVIVYFAFAFRYLPMDVPERFGTFVYNYYFLSLLDGRFDVPLRIISFEGQYDSDARAYVYHGLAPLVTRAMAYPFVDLRKVSLAPFTVWLFSVGGTFVYHMLIVRLVNKLVPEGSVERRKLVALLGVMIWFASPGMLLVSSDSFYHEPIAVAYFTSACFIALFSSLIFWGAQPRSILIPSALLAGLTVYARPHLAIGMYVGVCVLAAILLVQSRWRAMPRVTGAMLVLFAFGAALLAFNAMRFGDMTRMAGSGKHDSVEHGVIFWGLESSESPRMRAANEHGQFNPERVVPNLFLYMFDLPFGATAAQMELAYRSMTHSLGFIRIERPRIGMAYLWAPWFFVVVGGIFGRPFPTRYGWTVVLAAGIGALFMASYATVTLRYRIDIWPLVITLALLQLPRVLRANGVTPTFGPFTVQGLLVLSLVSSLITLKIALWNETLFLENPPIFSRWSSNTCAEMVVRKGLGADSIDKLCHL